MRFGRGALEAIDQFALRGDDAGAVDAQAVAVRIRPNSTVYQ